MKVRYVWAVVGALLAVGGGAVRADDVAASAVKLAYKFQPGAVFQYRLATSGTMNIDLSKMMPAGAAGGAGVPQKMPMDVSLQLDLTQKVKEVAADGSATLEQSVSGLDMNYKVMGMIFAATMKDGKLAFTMNGQPYTPPNAQGNPLEGTKFETRVSPTGRMLDGKATLGQALKQLTGGRDFTEMFGMGVPGIGMVILPAEPVAVGAKWEDQASTQMPMIMPVPGGGAAPKMDMKRQYTLKAIEQRDGHPVALIESQVNINVPRSVINAPAQGGAPAPPSMTIEKFTQTVTGASQFDIDAGRLQTVDITAKMAMQVQMPMPAAAPGAGQSGGMAMDGSFSMKLGLQTGAAPVPANLGTGVK